MVQKQQAEPQGWYDKDGRLRGSDKPLPGKCGAKLKCTNPPRYCCRPKTNCRIHRNKKVAAGPGHPRYKDGEYSKYGRHIPKKLREGYERAVADPKLLSLSDDVAALESRLCELLEKLDESEPPAWKMAVIALRAYEKQKDQSSFDELAKVILEGAERTSTQKRTWDEIKEVMELKGRLSAADHKRQVDIGLMISVKEADAIFNKIIETTRLEIYDKIDDVKQARQIMGTISQRLIPVLAPHLIIENSPVKEEDSGKEEGQE